MSVFCLLAVHNNFQRSDLHSCGVRKIRVPKMGRDDWLVFLFGKSDLYSNWLGHRVSTKGWIQGEYATFVIVDDQSEARIRLPRHSLSEIIAVQKILTSSCLGSKVQLLKSDVLRNEFHCCRMYLRFCSVLGGARRGNY